MKKLTFLLFWMAVAASALSQVAVNTTGSAPDNSAMLDVSSASKGVLVSRVALTGTGDATTVPAPATGLLVYNTATAGTGSAAVAPAFYFNGGTPGSPLWKRLATGPSGGEAWGTVGNAGTAGGTSFLGTTDNQPLDFRTNNTVHHRMTAKGQIEVLNTGQSVFLGQGAGNSDDLANRNNAFLGHSAGTLTTAGYNTAVGSGALASNTTGAGNTAVGASSGPSASNLSNTIALGFNAVPQSSFEIRLGSNTQTKLFCEAAKNTTSATSPSLVIDGATGQIMKSTAGAAGKVVFWDSPGILSSNSLFHWDNTNSVLGIGTAVPSTAARLHVVSGTTNTGYFQNTAPTNSTHVVHAECTGLFNAQATGVFGKAVLNYGYGYGGSFEGGYTGALGYVNAYSYLDYIGLHGQVSGLNAYGPSNNEYGVLGQATGFAYHGYGVYGAASCNQAVNIGVYGEATGTGTNYAGYFNGNVTVTGSLSKAGGSFRIDHPLDPENKYLYHSFVESPDMKNIYDGTVELDAAGKAVVEMPDWFEALNREFRYQLTCIGGYAQIFISEEITGNRFRISGGRPGLKVSWQVTGTRKDAWAENNRIPVEVAKTGEERGKYIHPEVFGQPAEKGIDYQRRQNARNRSSLPD